jgi:chemotaxis signal transduction protein
LLLILDADTIRERLAAGITRADDGRITELRSLPRRAHDPGRPTVERSRSHSPVFADEQQVLLIASMETADGGSGFAPAIPMAWVHEVRAWAAPQRLPHAPAALAGLMIWRERALPVIDLTQRLTGIPSSALDSRRRLLIVGPQGGVPLGALIVSGVRGLQTIASGSEDEVLPETLDPALFRSWVRHNAESVAILDPAACFA